MKMFLLSYHTNQRFNVCTVESTNPDITAESLKKSVEDWLKSQGDKDIEVKVL